MLNLIPWLIGLTLLLWFANRFGVWASRFGLPRVVGEILLGVLLGPTLLGSALPDCSVWLLPQQGVSGSLLAALTHGVVVLLLFSAGLEVRLKDWWPERGVIGVTVCGSFFIPLLFGVLAVLANAPLFETNPRQAIPQALFFGLALGVSALPVIIRILMELKLYKSRVGTVTVASAGLIDLLGWGGFALLLCGYSLVSVDRVDTLFGSHSIILGFIVGVGVGHWGIFPASAKKWLVDRAVALVSPLFFVGVGASANFVAHFNLELTVVVILLAVSSKLLGTFIGGKMGGLCNREALAVGLALNVRGAMEIILSKQALELGLIQPPLFVALVVMALCTSIASAPALQWLLWRGQQPALSATWRPVVR